jgi:hypothetical protein
VGARVGAAASEFFCSVLVFIRRRAVSGKALASVFLQTKFDPSQIHSYRMSGGFLALQVTISITLKLNNVR